MALLLNPWFVAAAAGLLYAGGSAAKNTGQAINTTANGALKMAAAGLIGYYILNQLGAKK